MKQFPILVLENQSDLLTVNTLYCLVSSKQLEVHLVSRSQNSPYRFLPGVKSFHYLPGDKPDSVFMDFIQQVAHKTRANLLVATNSQGVDFLIKHKATLQQFIQLMPIPERWAFDLAADKGLLAAFMLENAIPTPPTIFDFTEDLETALDDLVFPVLLKPKFGESGFADAMEEPPITEFKDKASLLAFIKEQKIGHKYIIQQFVAGYVVGCNVLYKNGKLIAYTIQKSLMSTRPFAPSIGIEFIDSKEVVNIVDALMSKLQWTGVANLDLIYDTQNHRLQVLEINPRFWLTIIGSMVRAKVNFPSLACQLALNQPIEPAPYRLGRYIPFGTFIKYRLTAPTTDDVRFRWNEIDMLHFWKTLRVKAYSLYKEKFRTAYRMAPEANPKVSELVGQ